MVTEVQAAFCHQDEVTGNVQNVFTCQLLYTFLLVMDTNEFDFFTDGSSRFGVSVAVVFIALCMLLMVSCR